MQKHAILSNYDLKYFIAPRVLCLNKAQKVGGDEG